MGRDPALARSKARAAELTVEEALAQFFVQHVEVRRKKRTAEEYQRTARLHIIPALGAKALLSIQRSDVAQLHHSLRHKPYQANRTVALLSKFFNSAEQHGFRPNGSNPCRHIEKYAEAKRDRFLSDDELIRLDAAMRDLESAGDLTPWMVAAVRLLLLTGGRLSEILTLKWTYFDEELQALRLPDSKTGAKLIHLSRPAADVLRQVPKIANNPHVICGERPGAHLVNLQKPWRRIRVAAGIPDVRLHDLRHTFASIAARQNFSLATIAALLGHTQTQTTARYAHFSAEPLRLAV